MIRTVILMVYGLLLLALSLRSLRAQRLKERYVLLFTITGLPFLVLSLWPDGIVFVSKHLEIEKPTLLVLALAAFVILIIFELFSIVSVQERRITALTQHVGILMQADKPTQRDPVEQRHEADADSGKPPSQTSGDSE